MSDPDTAQSWTQLALFPNDVLEFTLTVGVVRSSDHVQIQYQVHDPAGGDLLRLESRHHVEPGEASTYLAEFAREMQRDLSATLWPFPDATDEDVERFEADYRYYVRAFEQEQDNGNIAPDARPATFQGWLMAESEEYRRPW